MFDLETLKEFYTGKNSRILCIGLQKSEYKFLSDYLLEYAPGATINSSYGIDLSKIHIGSSGVNMIVLNNQKDYNKDIQAYYEKKVIVFGTDYDDEHRNKFINMLDGGEFYGNNISEIAKNVAKIALFIESRPLYDQNKLFDTLYNIEHIDERVYFEDNNTYAIKENSMVSIISPDAEDYMSFQTLLNQNIIGYYDIYNRQQYYFDPSAQGENLYYINATINNKDSNTVTPQNNNTYFIGKFNNVSSYEGKEIYGDEILYEITLPVIMITGIGINTNKMLIQLAIKEGLHKDCYKHKCITYNPLGVIFDMDVLKYDVSKPFDEIVYSINSYLKQIEINDSMSEIECLVINVGGGMIPLNRINTNHFGALYKAYLNATSVDYMVICTNSLATEESILNEIKKINAFGCKNIAVIVSKYSYDSTSLNRREQVCIYTEDKGVIDSKVNKLKKILPDNITVMSFYDTMKGELYRDIKLKLTK